MNLAYYQAYLLVGLASLACLLIRLDVPENQACPLVGPTSLAYHPAIHLDALANRVGNHLVGLASQVYRPAVPLDVPVNHLVGPVSLACFPAIHLDVLVNRAAILPAIPPDVPANQAYRPAIHLSVVDHQAPYHHRHQSPRQNLQAYHLLVAPAQQGDLLVARQAG